MYVLNLLPSLLVHKLLNKREQLLLHFKKASAVFLLKHGRVAPRHAIECEKGWGSDVMILHTSCSNSTGVHRAFARQC